MFLLEKVTYVYMFACRKTMWSLKSLTEHMPGVFSLGCLWTLPPSSVTSQTHYVCVSKGNQRGPVQTLHWKEAQKNHVTCSRSQGGCGRPGLEPPHAQPIQCFSTGQCCWACNQVPECLHCFTHLLFFWVTVQTQPFQKQNLESISYKVSKN